jgi:NADH:ubiquinone oxidoreductase subunit 5 (subunit L)/multisubunit Na+/H+ antiporter MnhA subunit
MNCFKTIFLSIGVVFLATLLVTSVPTFADSISKAPINAETVRGGAQNIVNILTFLAVLAAVIFLLVGGFQWSSGDAKNGKEKVKNAIIGLVVIFFAYVIIQLLTGVLGGIGGKADGTIDSSSVLP